MMRTAMAFGVLFMAGFSTFALDNAHFSLLGNPPPRPIRVEVPLRYEYAAGIEARLAVSHLNMRETAYAGSSGTDKLSEIEWNIGLQMAAGTALHFGPADPFNTIGFSVDGSALWYFPANNRKMKDSDWDGGTLFNYGESPASTLAGIEANGSIAALLPVRKKCLFQLGAQVWYGRHAAVAHDGWNRSVGGEKVSLYGTAVEYIQEWVAIAPEAAFLWKLKNGHIGLGAAVSPFVWGFHIDNHYFRKLENDDPAGGPAQKYLVFEDHTKGGIYCQVRGNWRIYVTKSACMDVAVQYRAIENSRGDTTVKTAGLAGYSFSEKGTAGAAIRTLAVEFAVRTLL